MTASCSTSWRRSIPRADMGDAADVEATIGRILSNHLHLDIPSTELDLFEAGVLDSLAFVELLLHLEQEFGITVSVEELEVDHFRTIRRIAEFLLARNGSSAAGVDEARTVPRGEENGDGSPDAQENPPHVQ